MNCGMVPDTHYSTFGTRNVYGTPEAFYCKYKGTNVKNLLFASELLILRC